MTHKQHYLHPAQARTLSVHKIYEMSNDEVFDSVPRSARKGEEVACPVFCVDGKR